TTWRRGSPGRAAPPRGPPAGRRRRCPAGATARGRRPSSTRRGRRGRWAAPWRGPGRGRGGSFSGGGAPGPAGGGAGRGARLAPWFVPAAALAALALAAAGLFWPAAVAAVLYGAEPAAAVLALALLAHAARHLRYRRRVTALSSFRRARPGSTMERVAVGSAP